MDQAKSIDRFVSFSHMATEQQDSRLCLASILEDFLKQRNVQAGVGVDSSSKNADETCMFFNSSVFSFLVHFQSEFSDCEFLRLGIVMDTRFCDGIHKFRMSKSYSLYPNTTWVSHLTNDFLEFTFCLFGS